MLSHNSPYYAEPQFFLNWTAALDAAFALFGLRRLDAAFALFGLRRLDAAFELAQRLRKENRRLIPNINIGVKPPC